MLRYDRQERLLGEKGIRRLTSSEVAVVGLGGLGSPISLYLAGSGVNLRLIDPDTVSIEDLNRQILYNEGDVGLPKALVAERRIREWNRSVAVRGIRERLTEDNAEKLLEGVDLIMDALDNFSSRYVIDRYSFRTGTPFVHAAVQEYYVVITFILPGETPCLRCIFPNMPDRERFEVLGPIPGVAASIAATEAIRYLSGQEPALKGRILVGDLRNMEFDLVEVRVDPSCEC